MSADRFKTLVAKAASGTPLSAADAVGFPARRVASETRGMRRGLGVGCFLETSRGAPGEWAGVRFSADGTVALAIGTQSNGQGHETSFPQIAADMLGLPIENFRLVQADTDSVPRGNGHGGARSFPQGGEALVRAIDQVIAKGKPIAAQLLQCVEDALHFVDGRYAVTDDPGALTTGQLDDERHASLQCGRVRSNDDDGRLVVQLLLAQVGDEIGDRGVRVGDRTG